MGEWKLGLDNINLNTNFSNWGKQPLFKATDYSTAFTTPTLNTDFDLLELAQPLNLQKTMTENGLSKYLNPKMLFGVGNALSGLSALGNAYLGFKNYGLGKKMYKTQSALAKTNLANQAKIINNEYERRAKVGAALGNLTPEERDRLLEETKKKYVSGRL